MTIESLLTTYSTYTGSKNNNIRTKLDNDSDGYWSVEELEKFADDYKTATGKTLDLEALYEKYDVNGDKLIGITEKLKIEEDDALGLKKLADEMTASKKEKEDATEKEDTAKENTQSITSALSNIMSSDSSISASTGLLSVLNQASISLSLFSQFNANASTLNGDVGDMQSLFNFQMQRNILGIELKYNPQIASDYASKINTIL